jgi:hypothetical protein
MTRKQIEELKRNWEEDPCWDLEDTKGFEDHRDELRTFRHIKEREWDVQNTKYLEAQAHELGLDLQTTQRVLQLEALAGEELNNAKRLLLHYFEMHLPQLDADNRFEIGSICEHIVKAATFQTLRHIEFHQALASKTDA